MSELNESGGAPKRRFPSFAGQALRECSLGEVTAESAMRNVDDLPATTVMGVSKTHGIVPMQEHVVASNIARYKVAKKNWFAYNPMRLNIGSIARWQGDHDILVSPDYVVFQCLSGLEDGIEPEYLDQLRQSGAWNAFVSEGGDGGVRIRIYYEDLAHLRLKLPTRTEQRTIADCLTSLDEVIAAQGRKVDALKAHKRGLMQQLFPLDGETRPRVRYPEFRDAPEWDERPTSTLISTVTPPKKIPTSGYQSGGRLAIVDQSPDAVCGWTDDLTAKVEASLPLIVFGDHTCVLKLIEHDFAQGADGIKIISAKPSVDTRFLFFALQADPLVSTSYRRHFSLLQEKQVAFPRDPSEQRSIADCLSAIDAQVIAEKNQLAALRAHKQGLMQQLFPAQEEA